MKKTLLILTFLFSFIVSSYSDPPAGYMYVEYTFVIKDTHGQFVSGAHMSIADCSHIDLNHSNLYANSQGTIVVRAIVPADPDTSPRLNDVPIVVHADGYRDFGYCLGQYINVTLIMEDAH